MFVPINTDAPLYHFPRGTIFLIIANVVCFIYTGFGTSDSVESFWMLQYGEGINPVEWLTSMFAHAGFSHLIGNMFFLWGFGLVVEGKLGWKRFLPLYLIMGMIDGGMCDVLTLYRTDEWALHNVFGVETREELAAILELDQDNFGMTTVDELLRLAKGGCLGSSSVVFALMAISLIWAPKNEMHLVGIIFLSAISFDITIMYFALFYFVMNFGLALLEGFGPESSTLHLLGVLQGLLVGTIYYFRGWVDCENWDLFAVIAGTHGRKRDEDWELGAHAKVGKDYSKTDTAETSDPDVSTTAKVPAGGNAFPAGGAPPEEIPKKLRPIVSRIDAGDFIGAAELLFELRLKDSRSFLNRDHLRRLAIGLLQVEAHDEAEIYVDEYLERFTDDTAWAKIRKAEILVEHRQRPAAAVQLLKTIKSSEISEQQKTMARAIAAKATQQIRSGVEDAEPEW